MIVGRSAGTPRPDGIGFTLHPMADTRTPTTGRFGDTHYVDGPDRY